VADLPARIQPNGFAINPDDLVRRFLAVLEGYTLAYVIFPQAARRTSASGHFRGRPAQISPRAAAADIVGLASAVDVR
jgi:hypothetical protein